MHSIFVDISLDYMFALRKKINHVYLFYCIFVCFFFNVSNGIDRYIYQFTILNEINEFT